MIGRKGSGARYFSAIGYLSAIKQLFLWISNILLVCLLTDKRQLQVKLIVKLSLYAKYGGQRSKVSKHELTGLGSLSAALIAFADPLSRKVSASENPRGIPTAPFIDKVEDYVTSRADVENTLKKFQEMIAYVCKGL